MPWNLTSKVAVVTGGSRGIGFSIAKRLQRDGCRVAICGRDVPSLHRAMTEVPSLTAVRCDVCSEGDCASFVKEVVTQYGEVDILVNNAGSVMNRLLLRSSDEDVRALYEANVGSAFRMSRLILKHGGMITRKEGCIIFVGSAVALRGNAGQCCYAAAKGALTGLTLSLAKELGPWNIRVNMVAPGFVRNTGMTESFSEEVRASWCRGASLRRMGDPEEVADVVSFVAQSSFLTGQVVQVDGGL